MVQATLIGWVSYQTTTPLPGVSLPFLSLMHDYFQNLSTLENIAASKFTSLGNYAAIVLFDENRTQEIAEDKEFLMLMQRERTRLRETSDFAATIHLCNYAQRLLEERTGSTKVLLIESGDPLRPETLKFTQKRWLLRAAQNEPEGLVAQWLEELKQPSSQMLREVLFFHYRENKPHNNDLAEKNKSILWPELAHTAYTFLEQRYQKVFPEGFNPHLPPSTQEKHDLALGYHLEKLSAVCEWIRKTYFPDMKEIRVKPFENQTESLQSLDRIEKGLKAVQLKEVPKKETGLLDLFLKKKEVVSHPEEWKALARDWNVLWDTLGKLMPLIASKPLSSPIKIPPLRSKRDLLSPVTPFNFSSSPRPSPPTSPKGSFISPRMLNASPPPSPKGSLIRKTDSPPSLPSPKGSLIKRGSHFRDTSSPRKAEIDRMAHETEDSPRGELHRTTLTEIAIKATEIAEMIQSKLPTPSSAVPPAIVVKKVSSQLKTAEPLMIADSKDAFAMSFRQIVEACFHAVEKISQPLIEKLDTRTLLAEYLTYLEAIEQQKYLIEIKPRLEHILRRGPVEAWKFLKKLNETPQTQEELASFRLLNLLRERGIIPLPSTPWTQLKEGYKDVFDKEEWQRIENPPYRPFGENQGRYTIPLLANTLDRPLPQWSLRMLLNKFKPEMLLEDFVASLKQTSVPDALKIHVEPHLPSCEKGFWDGFFAYFLEHNQTLRFLLPIHYSMQKLKPILENNLPPCPHTTYQGKNLNELEHVLEIKIGFQKNESDTVIDERWRRWVNFPSSTTDKVKRSEQYALVQAVKETLPTLAKQLHNLASEAKVPDLKLAGDLIHSTLPLFVQLPPP